MFSITQLTSKKRARRKPDLCDSKACSSHPKSWCPMLPLDVWESHGKEGECFGGSWQLHFLLGLPFSPLPSSSYLWGVSFSLAYTYPGSSFLLGYSIFTEYRQAPTCTKLVLWFQLFLLGQCPPWFLSSFWYPSFVFQAVSEYCQGYL